MKPADWTNFINWPDDLKWDATRAKSAQHDARLDILENQIIGIALTIRELKKKIDDLEKQEENEDKT